MVDKLQVDLIANNADRETAKVEGFRKALVKTDATAKTLNGPEVYRTAWDREISAIERRALNLGGQLKRIGELSSKPGIAEGLGKAAAAADAQVHKLYNNLVRLQQEQAKTKDPKVFERLQAEAAKTSADLDKLQNKIDRVAAGRQAAAARRPGGISAAGASGLANQAAGLGIPFAGEAAGFLDAGAALGVTSGLAAGLSVVGAAGALVVKYAKEYRAEQEQILHKEEAIAAAVNKRILAGKEVLKDAKAQAIDAEFQRNLSRTIAAQDIKSLEQKKKTAEQLRDLFKINNGTSVGDTEGFNRQNARVKEIDDAIANIQQQKTAAADRDFNQRNEDFKKAEAERAKKRLESIKEGKKAVDDFGKSTDELFGKLFAAQGAANPFVKVYTDAAAAIAETRIQTAGLSEDLQKQAAQMVATANANALFSARLDARLRASDLRGDARNLRGKPFIDPSLRPILEDVGGFNKFVDRDFASMNNPETAGWRGFLKNAIDQGRPNADQTVSDRLDRQLKVIRDLRPENEFQRAEADRKIIALTQGLNPADLTEAQRNAAAAARENEAGRLENAEKDAKAERAAQAEVQKSIDANIARLVEIADRDGLQGVIRIINDAEDVARDSLGQRRRASPADAKSIMD